MSDFVVIAIMNDLYAIMRKDAAAPTLLKIISNRVQKYSMEPGTNGFRMVILCLYLSLLNK